MFFEKPIYQPHMPLFRNFSVFDTRCNCAYRGRWRVYWFYTSRIHKSLALGAMDFIARLEVPEAGCACILTTVF